MKVKPFKLPDDFLCGSATAGTQIEGGDKNNIWFDWSEKGRIKDGSHVIRANDHWNRYVEDIELIKKMNHQVYRMSVEWSRIEPEYGKFDDKVIKRYRREIEMLVNNGIKPLVTLFHFSYPLWFQEIGAFENQDSIKIFERYVRYVVEILGDLVSEWVTINEPNVFATNSYLVGEWPPGKTSKRLAFKVVRNIILSHIRAYCAIHEIRYRKGYPDKTMVGVANHLIVFESKTKSILDKLATSFIQYMFQDSIMKSMNTGILTFPYGHGAPLGKGKYFDFLGINYYSRRLINYKWPFTVEASIMDGVEKNDMDWEVYPEGLYRLCKYFYQKYKAPIWITENGTCDRNDRIRAKYIYDHLYQIHKLINEGIPVQRYYHWTLMDNFEWTDGESARFGLAHVDFNTQKRTIRKSGEFYMKICKEKAVTADMLEEYLKN